MAKRDSIPGARPAMSFGTLVRRSLRFHARAHAGVVLGAAIGSAALIGALLVGDSVRDSLRERALQKLGGASFAMAAQDRFFGHGLGSRFDGSLTEMDFRSLPRSVSPDQIEELLVSSDSNLRERLFFYEEEALLLSGNAQMPSGEARANRVQIIGIDQEWLFGGPGSGDPPTNNVLKTNVPRGSMALNRALANQLHAQVGDEVILRFGRGSQLSSEAAISQVRDSTASLRLKITAVISPEAGGDLDLSNQSMPPMNAFVNWGELSERAGLTNKVNRLLIYQPHFPRHDRTQGLTKYLQQARELWNRVLFKRHFERGRESPPTQDVLRHLTEELQRTWTLEDIDLSFHNITNAAVYELRTSRVFLDPAVEKAAEKGKPGGASPVGILSYLATLIRCGTNSTPYSMVTASIPPLVPADLAEDEILLNQWLADDLHAKPGDTIELSYFLPETGARLTEATNRFRVRSIVPMQMPWADRTLMPDFPGIENAESTSDWDAGFPLVYKIRPKDEQYWKERKGTPKAFISLASGQKIWGNRFGRLTGIRFQTRNLYGLSNLMENLRPEELGLRFEPVRERALQAADQSQDFGQLFIGFSIFLVVAALLLMALLFQFGLEQRSGEVGLLLALGFRPRRVRRLFLLEGAGLALAGGILGTLGGVLYAAVMIWALNTMWSSAVANSALQFHATFTSVVIGLLAGFFVAVVTIWIALRKQARQPARELLGGDAPALLDALPGAKSRGLWIGLGAGIAAVGTLCWAIAKGGHADAEAFFSAGALLLIAGLAFVSAWLTRLARKAGTDHFTLTSLGVRGCGRRRTRSLATVALLACGAFLISSIGVFRLDADQDAAKQTSGTGGFALIGESTLPLVHDLNTPSGREFFGLDERELKGLNVVSFRGHAGDEASCLNLNHAAQPRLLGVNPDQLAGRFTFSDAAKNLERSKGWALLKSGARDEVAAIGDASSIEWAMGKKLGDTIDYADGRGRPFKVRLVAALANSVLQGSLVIDEAEFVKRFPDESGARMFLIDTPPNAVTNISAALSRGLQDQGLELTPAAQRLNLFNAVQNTYLGTFQILGGLGLLLGSVGLGVVVLRNVLERRGELGLLTAVGFRRQSLNRLLLGEHVALLALGLGLGVACAFVAVLPALLSPGTHLPYASLALTLGAVLLNGIAWTWLATRFALRGDLLAALRNE